MKLTGHKTEAVYRRYAIVADSDLREAGTKLAAALGTAAATASLGDNSGDNSVTARKGAARRGLKVEVAECVDSSHEHRGALTVALTCRT